MSKCCYTKLVQYIFHTCPVCALTQPGSQGIASADRELQGLASFPGHPGNEARHGHALWIINAPHTQTGTLMSQVVHNLQNIAYHIFSSLTT